MTAGQVTLPGFDDGKAPDALRTIGEVAKALGIRQHVLRYWEEQFPMLKPVKRSGGRRYYRPHDVELIKTIDRLVHHEGYTLRGARQAIGAGERDSAPVPTAPVPVETMLPSVEFPAHLSAGLSADEAMQLHAIRENLAAALAVS